MAEYCLRWNNHQPNLVTVFSELLNAESLVDVTLATDGHFIHAHKLVLSACSVYFKDLFGSNPCKHPIVFLKDIRIEDLKTVIDFIYRGEVNVSQERLQDVLKTAESLRIKGLADKPFSYDEYPSQSRGKHLSSSLSSQRSSLTDSREQPPSVDTEDCLDPANNNNNNNNNNANSPPASKKRKVAASQDSSESFHQDTNHEGEEQINDVSPRKCSIPASVTEARTPPIDKIKVEEPEVAGGTADTRPEYQESRAADAMLLLQGSSSEGGEEGGGVALPPTTVSRGDSSSSSLVSSHSQGRMDGGIVVTWIARGTSPVDWCEDNYSVTPHIAEFVNTISNVLFLLIPPACSSLWTSYSLHVSRGIHVVWFFYTVVGLSSAYFHATLSLLGQLLDELSILWLLLVSYSLFTPVCRRPLYMQKNPKVFKAFFALIGVLTSAFAFVKPEINQYALFMAGSPAMWMMTQEVRFCSNPKVGLFGKATIFALATAIIVWVSDRFLCNVWQHLNLPVLHGVWHVLIFMASYMMLVLFCYFYAMHDVPQSKPDLRFWPYKMCGLPYIYCRSSSTFKDP